MGTSVGPTTVVNPAANATPPVAVPPARPPRELGPKPGSNALAAAFAKAKEEGLSPDLAREDTAARQAETRGAHQQAAANALAAAAAGETEEVVEQPDVKVDARGRAHAADGKFVPKEGQAAADGAPETAEATEAPAADAEKEAITVVFPAHGPQQEIAIEVEDPAIADRLRELQKNGMRKEEYTRRLESVESREVEMRASEAALERAPEFFVSERLQPDQQANLALALAALHWDAIFPQLVEMADAAKGVSARGLKALEFKQKAFEAKAQADTERANAKAVQQIIRSVESLIPEGTEQATVRRFISVANLELGEAIRQGQRVAPDTVPTYLRGVLRDFGFDEPTGTDAGKKQGTTQRSSARAASEPTATNGASSTRNGTRDAQGEQPDARTKRIATARVRARAVTPAGAGGVPAQPVALPKGVGVKGAIDFLKQNPGFARTVAPDGQ